MQFEQKNSSKLHSEMVFRSAAKDSRPSIARRTGSRPGRGVAGLLMHRKVFCSETSSAPAYSSTSNIPDPKITVAFYILFISSFFIFQVTSTFQFYRNVVGF